MSLSAFCKQLHSLYLIFNLIVVPKTPGLFLSLLKTDFFSMTFTICVINLYFNLVWAQKNMCKIENNEHSPLLDIFPSFFVIYVYQNLDKIL